MPLTAGTRLGPYEIQSLIGSGGMGEVYKALDTRLDRIVAIKRLTAEHLERIEHEARAIAALNHPNICQVYDIGSDYLVLEYVQGEPLRGPVSPDEAVVLAIQIADALDAAHARGILHRDLKPANIMVTRRPGPQGTASTKLLDFGIAQVMNADPDATRTGAGSFVGTPAYMSPEQAQGEPVDARSDVFSFGAVLYELLTGTRAFAGESTVAVLMAVLRDEPPPFVAPTPLQRVVAKCLAKQPQQRFDTMAQVKAALEQVSIGRTESQASIAVLPFANLSGDKENEYFADGLAEEILNALANVAGFKVIARTSAFSFKGRNEDVRQIARTLGVGNVLEGSVRRAGERIRVTAQLVAASDASQLWSERYDRNITDVFAVQDEIAAAITTALKGKLGADASSQRHYTPSLESYELFLRGRHHLIRFTPDSWSRARVYFEQAIAQDPVYAEPHAELGLGYFIAGMHGMSPMREVAPFVRAEAQRALELDPSNQAPRFLLGAIACAHDYDWKAAEEHFRAAMSAPNVSPHARWVYGSLYLRGFARFQEGADQMARAVEQDPLNPTWRAIWAAHLIDAGHIDRAIVEATHGTEIEDYFVTRQLLGEAYLASGRTQDALSEFERAHQLAPWMAVPTGLLAATLWNMGEKERAEELVRGMAPMPLWGPTEYHLMTSQLDAAADWYERMIEQRDPFALVYALSAKTTALRAHPRWRRIAEMMNLPRK
jgi:serine/threonine-protein kinase